MFHSANLTEVGRRFSATTTQRIVGVWTATERRSLVPGVLTWKSALISVCGYISFEIALKGCCSTESDFLIMLFIHWKPTRWFEKQLSTSGL